MHQRADEIQQLKSAISELTLLNDLALAASSSLDVGRILDIIVERAIKALKAKQGSIMLVTPKPDAPLQTLIRQADSSRKFTSHKVGTHISGWVLKYRQPLLVTDLARDERFKAAEEEAKTIRTLLAVPMAYKGELIGVLIMTNKKHDDVFNQDDQRLLTIIAAQSAQLVRNSQLQTEAIDKKKLEYQLELARNMQRQLLPDEDPKFHNLDICTYFKAHKSVSGDYYDFFRLNTQNIALLVADVSGHGSSSALVMTLVKGVFHALIDRFRSPAQILTEANKILEQVIPADMFITMTFMHFDMQKYEMTYANAGHTPLIGWSSSDQKNELDMALDCPLNTLSGYVYHDKQISVNDGDVCFLYTDGLSEAMNPSGEMYGVERIGAAIKTHQSKNAQKMVETILHEVQSFGQGVVPHDDMVIMAIKIMS